MKTFFLSESELRIRYMIKEKKAFRNMEEEEKGYSD